MPVHLNVLDGLQIASPCPMNWDDMTGDGRARHCASCELDVYNIAGMSESEATQLITSREGRTCIRMLRRSDGTVITRDCPVGLAAVRRATRRARVAAVAALALAFTAVTHVWARHRNQTNGVYWNDGTLAGSLAETRAYARFSEAVLDPALGTGGGRPMMGRVVCPSPPPAPAGK